MSSSGLLRVKKSLTLMQINVSLQSLRFFQDEKHLDAARSKNLQDCCSSVSNAGALELLSLECVDWQRLLEPANAAPEVICRNVL